MNRKTSRVLLASCFSSGTHLKSISRCILKQFNYKTSRAWVEGRCNKHSVAGRDLLQFLREDNGQWIYLNVFYKVKEQLELKKAFQLAVVCQHNLNLGYPNFSQIQIKLIRFSQPKTFSKSQNTSFQDFQNRILRF